MKERIKEIFSFLIFIVIGGVAGFYIGKYLVSNDIKINFYVMSFGIVIFFLCLILQIILHEFGHLVFGLLSGYKFVSFRIGKIILLNKNGKLKVKKHGMAGTGGQCLMMPPQNCNGYDCPYFWYNAGGVIMNLVIAFLGYFMRNFLTVGVYLNMFFDFLFVTGIYIFITNGIPFVLGGISNDANNIKLIKKDNEARKAFYTQLKVNAMIYSGTRLKDIPLEMLKLNENSNLNNSLIGTIKYLEATYYLDKKDFFKAKETFLELKNKAPKIIDLIKKEVDCELLFLEIIGENKTEIIEKLYTKSLKKYINKMSFIISKIRLMYTYNLIVKKDKKRVDILSKKFDKAKISHPAESEVISEQELMDYVNEKFLKQEIIGEDQNA